MESSEKLRTFKIALWLVSGNFKPPFKELQITTLMQANSGHLLLYYIYIS